MVTITDVNETVRNQAPTDITLSNTSVAENEPGGISVGTFSTIDPDSSDSHTYTLVSGIGSADNAVFSINGNILTTAASFDYEVKNSYTIRVQTDDGHGGTFQKQFAITVTDVVEVESSSLYLPALTR